jgi:hypothetical protein
MTDLRAADPTMRVMMGPTLLSQPSSKIHSITSKRISWMALSTGVMMMVTPSRNFFLRACEHCKFTDSVTNAASNSKRRPIVFSAWFEGTYASGIMASVLS